MSYRDLLLPVVSYPDITPDRAIEAAVGLATRMGGALTALVLDVKIEVPRNVLADALIGLSDMARDEEARSAAQASASARLLLETAGRHGLAASAIVERVRLYEEAERVYLHARTRDLCLMPIGPTVLVDLSLAEGVLFGSGRPIVVFPEQLEPPAGASFETVAIAWDGSRAAARAVADSLPALQRADKVRVATFTGEKPSVGPGLAADLVRNLHAHGVRPVVDEIDTCGDPVGRVLREYVDANAVSLLVMGGFGHSRAREFILGGATASMIEAPPCPVLMSH